MKQFKVNDEGDRALKIMAGLAKTGGYCPCRAKRTEETRCPCLEFRNMLKDENASGTCHCGLYRIIDFGSEKNA